MSLLQIDELSVTFPTRGAELQAVKNLSLTLDAGETLGIVGESGSGKSVAVMSLLGLVPRPPAASPDGPCSTAAICSPRAPANSATSADAASP
jgi:ABC-type microcin C transport system duplicated ATPase subunit YejF